MNNNRTFNLNGTQSSFSHLCVLPTPLCWEEGNEFLKSCSLGGVTIFTLRGREATFWGKHLRGGPVIFPQHFCFYDSLVFC